MKGTAVAIRSNLLKPIDPLAVENIARLALYRLASTGYRSQVFRLDDAALQALCVEIVRNAMTVMDLMTMLRTRFGVSVTKITAHRFTARYRKALGEVLDQLCMHAMGVQEGVEGASKAPKTAARGRAARGSDPL